MLPHLPIAVRRRCALRTLLSRRRRAPGGYHREGAVLARLDATLSSRPVARSHRICARARTNPGPGDGGRTTDRAARRGGGSSLRIAAADERLRATTSDDDARQRRGRGQRDADRESCRARGDSGRRRFARRRSIRRSRRNERGPRRGAGSKLRRWLWQGVE